MNAKKFLVLIPPNPLVKNAVQDFLYGCWCKGRRIGGMRMPPLNHLYIATTLRAAGMECEFVDAGMEPAIWNQVSSKLDQYFAVAILSSTQSFGNDVKTLKAMKQQTPNLKSILFGSHPTFMPRYCLAEDTVDFVVLREPEFIIRDLAVKLRDGLDWREQPGIGFMDKGSVIINPAYPYIPMNELPIPDRSLLPRNADYFNPVVKRVPYTTMQSSRGCPAKCCFCTVPYFYGKKIRCRSTENIMEEIRLLLDQGYREIFFRDETFSAFKKRNLEVCRTIIAEKLDFCWIANARTDMIDAEQIEAMRDAGCHLLKFGVESGSQRILDRLCKGITLEQTKEAFRLCRKYGIDTHAHVMLGCPGETIDSLNKTIKFVKKIKPATASFGICTPYPGSPLFNEVAEKHPEIRDGSDADLSRLHTQAFFNETFTELTPKQLEKYVVRAYRKFYFRPSYLWGRLRKINSLGELYRLLIAAANIFNFGISGDN